VKIDTNDGNFEEIGIIHKNLIILCQDCHINLHKNKEELETLSTGNGKIIRIRPTIPPPQNNLTMIG
jgi:hypothetical protein